MYAYRRHISPCRHCRTWQTLAEIEVGAVGFVRKHQHTVFVGKLDYGADIGAYAVVGGIVHQHRLGVRVLADSLFNSAYRHTEGYAQTLVGAGVNVDRHSTAYNKGVYGAPVDVSGHDYLFPRLAGSEYHGLHCGGSSTHHKESVVSPESVRRQLFGFLYYRNGVAEVIQIFHGIDIASHTLVSQKGFKFFIHTSALVPRHVKPDDTVFHVFFQCLVKRRFCLV